MPTQTCFESDLELSLFLQLCPSSITQALSFSSWLNQISPVSIAPNRLEIATSFKKTPLAASEWLPTIELLRLALVLTPEQVTHCFSQLPSTKKNRALKDCFLFYLNSPLSQDLMSQVWSLVETLKSPGAEKPQINSVDFIHAEPSGYLFQELVKAASSLSSSVRSYSFSDLGSPAPETESPIFIGSRILALQAFGQKVATYAKSHPEEKILLSFFGSFQSKAFLRGLLASNGLLCDEFPFSNTVFRSFWSKALSFLRSSSFLHSEDRTILNSALLNHPPLEEESEQEYRTRLLASQVLTQNQLESFLTPPSEESHIERLNKNQILITPFNSLPRITGCTEFVFVDDTILERPLNSTLFSEPELETLFFAGFHVPRWSETLQSRLKILKKKTAFLKDRVYASLPLETLEGFRIESVVAPQKQVHTRAPSYDASLPVATLSATQLETYAECPSKYLYRRFKLNHVPMPMSEFALHLGQAVHVTLETLFSMEILPVLNEDLLLSTFHESLCKTLPHFSQQTNILLFFKKAFEKMLPRILELEKSLLAIFGKRTTLAVEKEFKIEINGLSIVGKIDRIDRLENESLLVLDYKTGTVDFTPEHLAKGSNFQALLYWLGAEQSLGLPPAAMLFYDLKKGEIKRGLAQEELISPEAKKSLTRGHAMPAEKLTGLIEAGKQAMQSHATQIKAGHFPPTPNPDACRFCEAAGFCREGLSYV